MGDLQMIRIEIAFLMLLTITLFASGKSQAALTLTPKVEGLASGTYKPLTTPALTGSNFVANGKVLINGKFVTIPGYIPPASTAITAAKTSLWSNPWLTGIALLGWSGDAGLNSTVDGTAWLKITAASPGQTISLIIYGTISNEQQCKDYGATTESGACSIRGGTYLGYQCQVSYETCMTIYTSGCNSPTHNMVPGSCTFTKEATPETTQAATLADFEALPPPPTQALAELAPQVGVPVDDPVYEPTTQKIGPVYTKPDGSTWEPWATFSPAGDGQVTADTYDKQITTSTGAPVSDPVNQDTEEKTETESPTQCEKFPDSLGCSNLDQPTAEDLNTEDRNIDLITPVTVGGAGQCPQPQTLNLAGFSYELPFTALCTYANAMRPLILAVSWLTAGMIFIGGVRNG